MTTTAEPKPRLMPTDAEIDAMDRKALAEVMDSHGLKAPAKATAAELRPWARALVHGARTADDAAHTGVGEPPADETPTETPSEEPEPTVAAPTVDTPPVDAYAATNPEPGVSLEPPSASLPDISRWEMIQSLAKYFFRANLRPKALQNEEDVGIVLLAAYDLGIPASQAMQLIHVQNGRLGMQGELMSALILRDGHELKPDPGNDATYAKVWGRRTGDDEWAWAEFSIEDALHADLCHLDDDGNVRARSKDGNPLPWERYTADMLYWRALARLARRNFPDSLRGVSYTPDELGWIPGEVADELEAAGGGTRRMGRAGETEPTMTFNAQRDEVAGRLHDLPEDLRKDISAKWKANRLPPLAHKDFKAGALKTVRGWVEAAKTVAEMREAEATAGVDEAVTVCPQEECEAETVGGAYCAEHAEPYEDPAAGTAAVEDAESGEPVRASDGDVEDPGGEVPTPGTGPDAASPDSLLECAACHEQIPENEPPVYGNNNEPYHMDCSPFG